uniref:Uncharacterized protein n=1 Tax=Arundo donax TaxID=35708 RepID=A0A0A8Z1M1_ARUDO
MCYHHALGITSRTRSEL